MYLNKINENIIFLILCIILILIIYNFKRFADLSAYEVGSVESDVDFNKENTSIILPSSEIKSAFIKSYINIYNSNNISRYILLWVILAELIFLLMISLDNYKNNTAYISLIYVFIIIIISYLY